MFSPTFPMVPIRSGLCFMRVVESITTKTRIFFRSPSWLALLNQLRTPDWIAISVVPMP